MKIYSMDNLEMIWHNQLDGDSIPNLQELKVINCKSLKYLFAASNVANDDYSPKFLFPKLTSMELSSLPELRSFYPGRHTVEGPALKRMPRLPQKTGNSSSILTTQQIDEKANVRSSIKDCEGSSSHRLE
ncbi:hypothetical protein Ddye_028202 [Dipteronia dyeriana]|uniref:Disease resistance protein At4g27190-like leucine-rich repeats domain-containing protein n=1 Tax=Dipteronia dyeriana TaxID=168575 RepID=A0AAD9TR09_9ROSI|nr:hypothetical protein Ddye_028202 [Dipteronia dyeriana]